MVPSSLLSRGPQQPELLRISTALVDAVDSHNSHHCCRSQWTVLQRTPATFAIEETSGQHNHSRLPTVFTTENPIACCVHRLQLPEYTYPTPNSASQSYSSQCCMDALGPGIHVSSQSWPLTTQVLDASPGLYGQPPLPCMHLQLAPATT